jgi:hypothetical protein
MSSLTQFLNDRGFYEFEVNTHDLFNIRISFYLLENKKKYGRYGIRTHEALRKRS